MKVTSENFSKKDRYFAKPSEETRTISSLIIRVFTSEYLEMLERTWSYRGYKTECELPVSSYHQ